MSQIYHNNAVTNYNIRNEIRLSNESIGNLSHKYGISRKTVIKWKKRDFVEDKSSRPDNINYRLSYLEKEIAISVRKLTFFFCIGQVRILKPGMMMIFQSSSL